MATSFWNLVKEYKVVIPIIQRDYAQGRDIGKVPKIRERFLNALLNAFDKDNVPLELDFVYGYIKVNENNSNQIVKSFIPLDGQQRLTALFLLHWYIAVKEDKIDIAQELLSKFTYETRHSSSVFCSQLVQFKPDEFNTTIDKTIIDQSWFFSAWHNDSTINSMLIVLKAIEEKFKDKKDIWPLLTNENAKIIFHLLPMEKLGLPDELYIKMNSRGKELSDFEYFKSQFTDVLHEDFIEDFKIKIDQDWSDLFWRLYEQQQDNDLSKLADNAFLRFYNYVTEILIVQNELEIEDFDELKIAELIYSDKKNCEFLFSSIESLINVYKNNPSFFNDLFYVDESEFDGQKIRLFFQKPSKDLFSKCANSYDSSSRINPFSIGEQLMLYACLIHLTNDTDYFNDRLRAIRNLISNSEDTVRKENMASLLKTVSEITLKDEIDEDYKFNRKQVQEESLKQSFIEKNNKFKSVINKIEDHHLLQGCLAILDLDDEIEKKSQVFHEIFCDKNSYEDISYALLTFGNYSQKYDWRRRLGNNNNSTWRELLTPSNRRENFNDTKQILNVLIEYLNNNPDNTLKSIISNYIDEYNTNPEKGKDWIYYYIKYNLFSRNEEGFTYWPLIVHQYENKLMRKTTLGGFHWSPYLLLLKQHFGDKLSFENYGTPITLTKKNASIKIINSNNGYKIDNYDDENSVAFVDEIREKDLINEFNIFIIKQNENNTDIEDRIEKGIELINNILNL